ncbi:unnamed protein product [Allacma fusca]|uniref:chitin synthase n=1 Tax=Allacma fusca TaxID=39272 RepID=A0A8J2PKQ0_9HEXA|nr:unnamed protein product [Allacma fusca]
MATLYRADSDEYESEVDEDVPFGSASEKKSPAEPPLENWDVFQKNPPQDESLEEESQRLYQYSLKGLKLLTYVAAFAVILGTSVISKVTLLLMTSQLDPGSKRPLCFEQSTRKRDVEISLHERIQWTWAIFFCFLIPEILTLYRSLRIAYFKGPRKPNFIQFAVPMFFEVCHTIGLGLFTFTVLPSVHVVKASMLGNAVCLLPAVLSMISRYRINNTNKSWLILMFLDLISVIFQIFGLLVWPFVLSKNDSSIDKPWLLPLSATLISFGWWENYVSKHSKVGIIRTLAEIRKNVVVTRYHSYIYISITKMLVFLATMCLSVWIIGDDPYDYFNGFNAAFGPRFLNATEIGQTIAQGVLQDQATPSISQTIIHQNILPFEVDPNAAINGFLIQFCVAYACYFTARFACKICIQGFSFSFPLSLSVPVSVAFLVGMCGLRSENVCFAKNMFPGYLFWTCPKGDFAKDFLDDQSSWVWILLLLSQTWITIHIWYPSKDRLARTDALFCRPLYNGLLTDQDLVLNRKQTDFKKEDDFETNKKVARKPEENDNIMTYETDESFDMDKVPKIIACATMWHENSEEMVAMFKSVFRMDWDQNVRRKQREYFGVLDAGYYEYETHIFFDDAFKAKDGSPTAPFVINDFVRLMMPAIEEAASLVHEVNVNIASPKKIPTPYGGRLEFLLPGKTKLTVHLKDKQKIRHRKRWSQCMYMYYLLGFKLADRDDLSAERKDIIAQNTFLLALDGDIDFQANAVELLVDLMKKTPNLGAACGRIHPIGTGPMVWYQKFEYAIGHWLQKATEHMVGCVLCSPGCFSLFRAAGLMDVNVMKTYTTEPSEARHYVQYDQGEDRWLCTLLLQQGWRVEYSAASDALTHAPEGFNEFYNQRRRWVPSTMANILDLLMSYRQTIRDNPDISFPYVCYQFILMGGSILGPGTIFLMLVGAFVAAFKVDNFTSFYINVAPLLLFILVCYFCKAKIQLMLAQLLSVIYALVMVAVLIALILQVLEDGLLAPSSIFLVAITVSFVVSALLHPLEFSCLLHGLLYYITIPSMYMLLIIYSLFNLNDVTWGTRETPQAIQQQKLEEQAEAAQAAQGKGGKKNGKLSFLSGIVPGFGNSQGTDDSEGSFEFSCAGLFKLMCCVHAKPKDDTAALMLKIHEDVLKTSRKVEHIEKSLAVTQEMRRGSFSTSSVGSTVGRGSKDLESPPTPFIQILSPQMEEDEDGQSHEEKPEEIERDDLMNPYWIEDKDLKKGPVDFLSKAETTFWKKFIKKYLLPLNEDREKKKKIQGELLDLRNSVVGAFFMFNAVFVTALFLLQLNKDKLFFEWPLGGTHNFTYKAAEDEIELETAYLQLEPLGLLFVGFYAIVLVVQFIAMICHRWGTFSHIMCHTSIGFFSMSTDGLAKENAMEKEGVKVIRKLMKLKTANEDSPTGSVSGNKTDRRKTIVDVFKQNQRKARISTMDGAFKKNFSKLEQQNRTSDKGRRKSTLAPNPVIEHLMTRRKTVLFNNRNSAVERRNSQMMDGFGGRRGSQMGNARDPRRSTFGDTLV